MSQVYSQPWNPDRRWADIFIASLALMILLLLSGLHASGARHHAPSVSSSVGTEGRMEDILLAAPRLLESMGGKAGFQKGRSPSLGQSRPGWDEAILAVDAGERGDLERGTRLSKTAPGPTGEAFRRIWLWCYQGQGSTPSPSELGEVQRALGQGYAAKILEARIEARKGGDPKALEAAAMQWALPRLMALGGAVILGLALVLAGVGFGIYLTLSQATPHPLPTYRLSGRAVLIVLLGWFLTLLVSTPAIQLLLVPLPFLRSFGLPLVYLFHATLGIIYICRAEGLSFGSLRKQLFPGAPGRAFANGLGFFALAFVAILVVSVALSPLVRNIEPPQKELLELMTKVKGPLVILSMFLCVAVVAPLFEETLFRGFLLPWLGERLGAKLGPRAGWILALGITAITFGAMHMEPWGLPSLSALGLILGMAYVRTGNLGTAVVVHGLWNGSVFVMTRLLC